MLKLLSSSDLQTFDTGDKLFDEIECHWNYFNYDFFQCVIENIASPKLKQEINHYKWKLKTFMKKTTVKDWYMASVGIPPAQSNYETVAFILEKDPEECTLYDIHKLNKGFKKETDVRNGGIALSGLCVGSVNVMIAVAPAVFTKVLKVIDNPRFREKYNIVETKLSFSESSSDNKYLKQGIL